MEEVQLGDVSAKTVREVSSRLFFPPVVLRLLLLYYSCFYHALRLQLLVLVLLPLLLFLPK